MRARAIVVAAGIAAALVGSAPSAGAADLADKGFWVRLNDSPLPVPRDSKVPEGGLRVAGAPDGALAVAAVRFRVSDEEADAGLVLTLDVAANQGGDRAVLLACANDRKWTTTDNGKLSQAPKANCAEGRTVGTRAPSGTSFTFEVGSLITGGVLDLVLIPGTVEGAGAVGSVFDIAFAAPTSSSLAAAAPTGSLAEAGGFPSTDGGFPSGAGEPPPPSDPGTEPSAPPDTTAPAPATDVGTVPATSDPGVFPPAADPGVGSAPAVDVGASPDVGGSSAGFEPAPVDTSGSTTPAPAFDVALPATTPAVDVALPVSPVAPVADAVAPALTPAGVPAVPTGEPLAAPATTPASSSSPFRARDNRVLGLVVLALCGIAALFAGVPGLRQRLPGQGPAMAGADGEAVQAGIGRFVRPRLGAVPRI